MRTLLLKTLFLTCFYCVVAELLQELITFFIGLFGVRLEIGSNKLILQVLTSIILNQCSSIR